MTLVKRFLANDQVRTLAFAHLAGIGLRAAVPIVAARAVFLGWIRAHAGIGTAGPNIVALVAGTADDLFAAHALPGRTAVSHGAGISIVTGRLVRFRLVRTLTGLRIAVSRLMAVVGGRAFHLLGALALAALTGGEGASVYPVAEVAVLLLGVRASPT